jgi:hypothetical protein
VLVGVASRCRGDVNGRIFISATACTADRHIGIRIATGGSRAAARPHPTTTPGLSARHSYIRTAVGAFWNALAGGVAHVAHRAASLAVALDLADIEGSKACGGVQAKKRNRPESKCLFH